MQLRTEIEIEAPPQRVWQVLTDFSAYHEWNPFITSIAGDLLVGKSLAVTISPPESKEANFFPRVLVCDESRELRWLGKFWIRGLFDGEHFFQLQPGRAEGRTRFVHGEDFRGLLVKYAGQRLTHVARGFVYMNQALKRRVES
jgi:hypothetical protein